MSSSRRKPARAAITVRVEHPAGAAAARLLRRRAREYLTRLGREEGLSLLVTTDAGIRRLNREYLGKDRPTDVLSFPAAAIPGAPPLLGDLAVSLDTARRAARAEGRPLAEELSRYIAHGLLHLLGLDHERSAAESRRMARKEAWLLGGPGMLRALGPPLPADRGGKGGTGRGGSARKHRGLAAPAASR